MVLSPFAPGLAGGVNALGERLSRDAVETGAMRCIESRQRGGRVRNDVNGRQGYRRFRYACGKQFNECSGGNSQSRSISIRRHRTRGLLAASPHAAPGLRDSPEMFLDQGIEFRLRGGSRLGGEADADPHR